MASRTLNKDDSGSLLLAEDRMFYVDDGTVYLSTINGEDGIPYYEGQGERFSTGLTVYWTNKSDRPAMLIDQPV